MSRWKTEEGDFIMDDSELANPYPIPQEYQVAEKSLPELPLVPIRVGSLSTKDKVSHDPIP